MLLLYFLDQRVRLQGRLLVFLYAISIFHTIQIYLDEGLFTTYSLSLLCSPSL